ncbi:hypothetical protein [Candidatus Nanopusillus massiliensis]|uniref:hypothetical protein n=1 Tax=Candidatus Nanopusillus massiliensis TaxID=2897163 RepID=UPI001E398AC4|nr:hypothetical protein [Candidatus Nanopusillus massiliensis]
MAKRLWRIFKEIERPYTRFSYIKSYNEIPGAPVPKLRMQIMENDERNQRINGNMLLI